MAETKAILLTSLMTLVLCLVSGLKDAGPAARFYGTTPQPGRTLRLLSILHAVSATTGSTYSLPLWPYIDLIRSVAAAKLAATVSMPQGAPACWSFCTRAARAFQRAHRPGSLTILLWLARQENLVAARKASYQLISLGRECTCKAQPLRFPAITCDMSFIKALPCRTFSQPVRECIQAQDSE